MGNLERRHARHKFVKLLLWPESLLSQRSHLWSPSQGLLVCKAVLATKDVYRDLK